jgi:hypothetical protein
VQGELCSDARTPRMRLMSRYYSVEPEVPGGDYIDRSVLEHRPPRYPRVLHLHCVFEAWLGDELVAFHPCYLVTRRLATELSSLGLSGFAIREAEIELARFTARDHAHDFPAFVWLDVPGVPGKDDFGLTDDASLIVSEAALACLRAATIRHCSIADYKLA